MANQTLTLVKLPSGETEQLSPIWFPWKSRRSTLLLFGIILRGHAMPIPGVIGYSISGVRVKSGLWATVWFAKEQIDHIGVAVDSDSAALVWQRLRHICALNDRSGQNEFQTLLPQFPWCGCVRKTPSETAWLPKLERSLAWAWLNRSKWLASAPTPRVPSGTDKGI